MNTRLVLSSLLLLAPAARTQEAPAAKPAAAPAAAEKKPAPDLAANKALTRKAFDALNAADWKALESVIAPDVVDHQAPPGAPAGRDGVVHMLQGLVASFPDFKQTIEDMIAEGDKVVVRSTISGTQKGEYMGLKPTGKSFTMSGIDIFRVEDGKLVEHWGNEDDMGMMQQLGATPAPEPAKK